MKQPKHRVLFITTPLICITLGLLLMISHKGMPMEARPLHLSPLAQSDMAAVLPAEEPEILLLAQENSSLRQTVEDSLTAMRMSYTVSDHFASSPALRTVLLCEPTLPSLEGEGIVSLFQWIQEGGSLGILTSPALDGCLPIVSHKLGILEVGNEYRIYRSFQAGENALSVFSGLLMNVGVEDYTLPVRLDDRCQVLLRTGDESGMPLMWSCEIGQGRAVVCNHSLISGKDARGFLPLVLQNLQDILVYPILNTGMIFIDDFPAPQPEGYDDYLREQYGLSIQGFFRNHWWPDMKSLVRKYGIRYTGVLVETYNRTIKAPFVPDNEDNALIRYYASELLQQGGEIGLHGYNHQPLCLTGWQYADEDYITWESEEDMQQAVKELVRYGHSFLPNATFSSYVPPSNYLSDEGKSVLLRTVPTLLTISGVYLPEEGIHARVQEFHEEEDGSVSVPRVTSGFSVDCYGKWVAAGELNLRGVFSHFIHPDDVLDEERGALLGWERLHSDFYDLIDEITSVYPALRWCTATEAAAAVQRYERVQVRRSWQNGTLTLSLSPFYDEVWLCLSSEKKPAEITGAQIYPAGDGWWLKAEAPTVTLRWEDTD